MKLSIRKEYWWPGDAVDGDFRVKLRRLTKQELDDYLLDIASSADQGIRKKITEGKPINRDEMKRNSEAATVHRKALFMKHVIEVQGFEFEDQPCTDLAILWDFAHDIRSEILEELESGLTKAQEKK